jgi:hypothetical protein
MNYGLRRICSGFLGAEGNTGDRREASRTGHAADDHPASIGNTASIGIHLSEPTIRPIGCDE